MSDKPQSPKPAIKGTSQNNPSSKSSVGFGRFFVALLALLALLLSGAGIAIGYKAWLDMNKRLDQASVDRQSIAHEIATIDESIKLQNFKKQVENHVSEINQQVDDLAEKVQKQIEAQQDISLTAQETLAIVNRSQLGWGLKEVEHILRMANHRLRIERDVAGSITALNTASERLHELKDPRLLPVRETISKQIGKLKNFPYPDWVGISLQLDNILAGLKQNIIKSAKNKQNNLAEKDEEQSNANEEKVTGWKKLVDGVKNSINDSIKVTKEEQRLKVFISQQESEHAYEFLRGKLLSAKYAVASRNDEAYHREIEAALAWLESNDTLKGKKEIISELSELNDINLEPELPDITEANTLLLETANNIDEG